MDITLSNMKLRYKNNQWEVGEVPEKPLFSAWDLISPAVDTDTPIRKYEEALELALSQFKPIAPNDQEKVNRRVWELIIEDIDDRSINNKELRKLLPADYDDWNPEIGKLYDSGDLEFELEHECEEKIIRCKGCDCKQFWILNDKSKKQQSETKDIHEFLLNKGIDSEIKIGEHFLTDLLESFTRLYSKQLQVKINSLEEQRERLIAKLMNDEDKIKESN